jgi:hypothetical protein
VVPAGFDYAALSPRILRPDRPQLHAAVGCVVGWDEAQAARWRDAALEMLPLEHLGLRGILDAREAWEAMAARGLIPMEWVGAAERGFLASRATREEPWPPGVRFAVTLASDPQGIATAEVLAREVAARLAPWGLASPARVVWRVMRDPRAPREVWPASLSNAMRLLPDHPTVRTALEALSRGTSRRPGHDWPDALYDARTVVRAAATWSALAARGDRAPAWPSDALSPDPRPDDLEGRPFATLPDPFEPLLILWASGYLLAQITGDTLLLAREL